jgi:hypothetical protein
MRTKLKYLAALFEAGATAAVLTLSPVATAAAGQASAGGGSVAAQPDKAQPQQSCVSLGGSQNECESPGNAQIYDAPPQVDYYPYAGGGT